MSVVCMTAGVALDHWVCVTRCGYGGWVGLLRTTWTSSRLSRNCSGHNVCLSEAPPKPTMELVDISYPEFEPNIYEVSPEKPVWFAFGAPVVIRESADSSQSGQYVPAATPLLH